MAVHFNVKSVVPRIHEWSYITGGGEMISVSRVHSKDYEILLPLMGKIKSITCQTCIHNVR